MTEEYDQITSNNQGGAFPLTRGINASGPLATDGTEYIKEVLDDIWATKQSELDFYNNSPNGLPNDPGIDGNFLPVSQPLAQQYMNYQTPGAVIPIFWNPAQDPLGVGIANGFDVRIMLLQGQGIDRTLDEFKALDALCYVGNAANATADSFFRADNANGTSRNIAGQFLILADMRGQTLRGYDPGALIDPDGASRIPGSIQLDALQNITGSFESRGGGVVLVSAAGSFTLTSNGGSTDASSNSIQPPDDDFDLMNFNASNSPGARTATESRAVNLSVRWGIYF